MPTPIRSLCYTPLRGSFIMGGGMRGARTAENPKPPREAALNPSAAPVTLSALLLSNFERR
ncbi:MAG: hypothetical protein QW407_06970 [Thermofilaceae archaeon]